jgi:hypothetical protein
MLVYLIKPALEQLEFFRCAVQFLDAASDELLTQCAREYLNFLIAQRKRIEAAARSGAARELPSPSFEVELVWRAHLLRPQSYAQDCAFLGVQGAPLDTSTGALGTAASRSPLFIDGTSAAAAVDHSPEAIGWYTVTYAERSPQADLAGLPESWFVDLAQKTRRDGTFMRQILELELSGAIDRRQLVAQLPKYAAYLRRCAGGVPGTLTPVPSKTLDLVWHTHQLHPRRYAQECALIAGSIINHVPDDD